ncbi:MAG: zf-HC2 domain-containing protein, partial [Fimbriimonadaceae bacterium]
MKCNEIQKLIAIDLSGELKPGQRSLMQDHLSECATCREWVAFHRSLENHMNEPVLVPSSMETRVAQLLAASPAQVPWLTRVFGNNTMKKLALSTSTLAVLAVGAFVLFPRTAAATTPLESFKKMRSAFTAAAKRGELKITTTANTDGTIDTKATLDGKELPGFPINVESTREGDNFKVHITADLEPEHYKVIRFGKAANTLELVRKETENKIYQIKLDPKTQAPVKWDVIEVQGYKIDLKDLKLDDEKAHASKQGDPIRVQGFPIEVKDPKPVAKADKHPTLDVHIALRSGQTAV